jgi:hypothetical protein
MASPARHVEPPSIRVAPRGEADWRDDLRTVGEVVAVGLAIAGAAVAIGAVCVPTFLALPLHHVALRPPVWLGILTSVLGASVARACRRPPSRQRQE